MVLYFITLQMNSAVLFSGWSYWSESSDKEQVISPHASLRILAKSQLYDFVERWLDEVWVELS